MPKTIRRILTFLASAAGLIIAVAFLRIYLDQRFYERHAPALNRDLGFDPGSPYLSADGEILEVMTISVTRGGVFDLAGIRPGDIPVDHRSKYGFYRWLEASRGLSIFMPIVSSGDGPPLLERPVRKVEFSVPSSS